MSRLKRLQFSVDISAPPARVYEQMTGKESYRQWTSAFTEGSYYEGSWNKGEKIRFLCPTGDGMLAEIAENRPDEFISIRHLGQIVNGVEDTESPSIKAWAPAYENYSFNPTPQGTRLVVDQDVTEDFEDFMAKAWPQALDRLKTISES